jgi:hypothetical protein
MSAALNSSAKHHLGKMGLPGGSKQDQDRRVVDVSPGAWTNSRLNSATNSEEDPGMAAVVSKLKSNLIPTHCRNMPIRRPIIHTHLRAGVATTTGLWGPKRAEPAEYSAYRGRLQKIRSRLCRE